MWGDNQYSQIGDGSDMNTYSIEEITPDGFEGTIKQISLGGEHSGAIVTDNSNKDHLYMWGWNSYDQIGNCDELIKNVISPEEIILGDGIKTIKQISLGDRFSAAIVNDGTNDHLYIWGDNSDGQIGNGDESDSDVESPIDDNGLNNLTKSEFILNDNSIVNITPTNNSVKLTIKNNTSSEKIIDSSSLQTKMNDEELNIELIDDEMNEKIYLVTFEIIGLQSGVMYSESKGNAI